MREEKGGDQGSIEEQQQEEKKIAPVTSTYGEGKN